MDPVSLALMGGGMGLSWLQGRAKDRAETKRRREIMKLSSPEHLSGLTNQLYGQFMNGPAYQQGQRSIFNSTASMGNQLNSSLAARGLSTSGIGSVAPALANSAGAGQLGQLRTSGYNAAGQQAGHMVDRQINTLGGFGGAPNEANAALGGGIADLSEMLLGMAGKKGKKMPKYKTGTGGMVGDRP